MKKVRRSKVYVKMGREEKEFETDLIILAVGRRSLKHLENDSNGLVEKVFAIGDCVSPRKIKDAIWEAFKLARSLTGLRVPN